MIITGNIKRKKRSNKSDFESLVRNKNVESKAIVELTDYESTTSRQKERINNILDMLQIPNNEYDEKVEDTYLEFKQITRREKNFVFRNNK